jgi:hypothetical protein
VTDPGGRDPRDKDLDRRDSRELEGPNPDIRDTRRPGDVRDPRAPGDVRDVRTLVDLPDGPMVRNAPASIVATGYALLGLSLCLEPSKWDRTPAYAVLLDIAPQRTWGLVLLFLAVLLGTAMWVLPNRVLSVAAHLVAIMFTASWMVAFTVRWATDPKQATTPMNGVMWAMTLGFLVISLRAAERYWASIPGLRDLD